jgi:ribosomal protein S12 methylthiotransferase accessory factor
MDPVQPAGKVDLGGAVRSCRAEDTLARLEPQLLRIGITRYADVTRLDSIGIPVALCFRPNSKTLSVSQGKGTTLALATVSAVMESVELYHAERAEPALRASVEQLRAQGRRVLQPSDLEAKAIAAAFSTRMKCPWSRGRDLVSGEEVLVPFGCVSLDLHGHYPGVEVVPRNGNGLASGNNVDEAILHALCEVIERDCEWRFRRLSLSERRSRWIDTDSVRTPALRTLLERLAAGGAWVAIWDMTSETGVPAYRCILSDRDGWRGLGRFYGAGCHPSVTIALSRALTEAALCRLTHISGARDDLLPERFLSARRHGPLDPERPGLNGAMDFHRRRSRPLRRTFAEDWADVVAALTRAGYPSAVAVDLCLPDVEGVAVTKVIVPGLRKVV